MTEDLTDRALDQAFQGLKKSSILVNDDEFSEWLDETAEELHDQWEEIA